MRVIEARQQAQGTAAGLRTRWQRGSGLEQHRQWVALGSAAAGLRAEAATETQGSGHTGAR